MSAEVISTAPKYTTYRASFAHWWSSSKTASRSSEEKLLRRGLEPEGIPLVIDESDPSSKTASAVSIVGSSITGKATNKVATLRRIQLDGKDKDKYLNCLEIGEEGGRKKGEHNLLLLHGYGGGIGFYFQNLAALASVPNTRVWCLDLPGMGRSGRTNFPSIPRGNLRDPAAMRQRVSKAENWFVDQVEEFREKTGIDNMTVVAHSLGGYISVAYTLKHPERVSKLVLVSPAGVSENPNDSLDPEPVADVNPEFRQDQMQATLPPVPPTPEHLNPQSEATEGETHSRPPPPPTSVLRRTVFWLWEQNISPISVIRNSFFLGPRLVGWYASNRFNAFDPEAQFELFDYLYQISRDKGSGEFCLAHLLAPGAWARWPLVKRIEGLRVPVTFIYGQRDWMDPTGGRSCVSLLRSKLDATPLQRSRSKVLICPRSSHWVFLDNPEGFNKIIRSEILEAVGDGKGV